MRASTQTCPCQKLHSCRWNGAEALFQRDDTFGRHRIHFETVDVMRVQNGKITDHWGGGNLLSLMQQIGGWIPPADEPQQKMKK